MSDAAQHQQPPPDALSLLLEFNAWLLRKMKEARAYETGQLDAYREVAQRAADMLNTLFADAQARVDGEDPCREPMRTFGFSLLEDDYLIASQLQNRLVDGVLAGDAQAALLAQWVINTLTAALQTSGQLGNMKQTRG
jgi:hypothetical protein